MAKKEHKRPDETALRRVLERHAGKSTELILRLAWTAGLNATEIHELKWRDVSFAEEQIRMADRSVPMDEELRKCLQTRYERSATWRGEYVVTTDLRRVHMHRVHVSKFASEALDEEEALRDITLKDLREDFVIRMLEKHDWPYVARISGMAISTLYANYSQYMKREQNTKDTPKEIDEFAVWQMLQTEATSPERLALWMSRELGLTLKEIAALTWQQVDMEEKLLRLPDRDVPMGVRLERLLRQVKEKRQPDADPHVLLAPRSKGPFDARRLGVVVRQALIRGGMDEITAEALSQDSQQQREDEPILQAVETKGSITRNEAMEMFGLTQQQAWRILNRLSEQGKLTRVGLKYFKAGTVAAPAEQYDLLRAHLEKRRSAGRQELAAVLNIEPRQCGWILNRLTEEGKLVRDGRKYRLPERNKITEN